MESGPRFAGPEFHFLSEPVRSSFRVRPAWQRTGHSLATHSVVVAVETRPVSGLTAQNGRSVSGACIIAILVVDAALLGRGLRPGLRLRLRRGCRCRGAAARSPQADVSRSRAVLGGANLPGPGHRRRCARRADSGSFHVVVPAVHTNDVGGKLAAPVDGSGRRVHDHGDELFVQRGDREVAGGPTPAFTKLGRIRAGESNSDRASGRIDDSNGVAIDDFGHECRRQSRRGSALASPAPTKGRVAVAQAMPAIRRTRFMRVLSFGGAHGRAK